MRHYLNKSDTQVLLCLLLECSTYNLICNNKLFQSYFLRKTLVNGYGSKCFLKKYTILVLKLSIVSNFSLCILQKFPSHILITFINQNVYKGESQPTNIGPQDTVYSLWWSIILYNLNLIKLYLAWSTAIKTAIDACSLLAKDILWSSWKMCGFINH